MQGKIIIKQAEVKPSEAGLELGVFAREVLGLSSRRLQKAVRTQGLMRNGRPAHSKSKLRAGDVVQVALPAQEQVKIPVAKAGACEFCMKTSGFWQRINRLAYPPIL